MGSIYKNEVIEKDKFEMVVTVFGIGQGNCNMIEIYEKTINPSTHAETKTMVQLIMIDLGTSSGVKATNRYVDLQSSNNGVFTMIHAAMLKRAAAVNAAIADPSRRYYAYMDIFFLTHQDEDHQNKLVDLIKYLLRKQGAAYHLNKGKYINNIYLSGFDYADRISKALMSNDVSGANKTGAIRNAVIGEIYHLSHKNQAITTKIPPKSAFENDPPNTSKVKIYLCCLMSCLKAYNGLGAHTVFRPNIYGVCYTKKPIDPSTVQGSTRTKRKAAKSSVTVEPSEMRVNFFSMDTAHNAAENKSDVGSGDLRNIGSAIFQLYIQIPGSGSYSYIFTGDAQLKTFEAFNAIDNTTLQDMGKVNLFTIPHHGAYRTNVDDVEAEAATFDTLKAFVEKFGVNDDEGEPEDKLSTAVATGQVGQKMHGHPNHELVLALEPYCAEADDHLISYYTERSKESTKVNSQYISSGIYNTEHMSTSTLINDIEDSGAHFTVIRNHFQFKADKNGANTPPDLLPTEGYRK